MSKGLDLTELTEELRRQTAAISGGDMSGAEAMLVAQVHSLNAIFNALAMRALSCEDMGHRAEYLKLALRAQAQTARTWEAVSKIRNPPLAGYIGQANIAGGHQLVDNGKEQTKLLEKTGGNRLEFGMASAAGTGDTPLAAVGAVQRSKDADG